VSTDKNEIVSINTNDKRGVRLCRLHPRSVMTHGCEIVMNITLLEVQSCTVYMSWMALRQY